MQPYLLKKLYLIKKQNHFIMKRLILLFSLLLATVLAGAQAPYRVVFDITSKDSVAQKAVMRWVNEIAAAHPNAQLEVVYYGQSLNMVTQGSPLADAVKNAATKKIASFKVCAMAMQRNNVTESQLLPGVTIVPDGIYEIVSRQHDGWAYIKVSL